MTGLSSAAQAVWRAHEQVLGGECVLTKTDMEALAAALRAAADQLTPGDKELSETYLAGYYAEKNRQGPACQAAGLRAVLAKWGKDPLLAIADELDGLS